MNKSVELIDPAKRTAIDLKEILDQKDLLNEEERPRIDFYSTKDIDKFKSVVQTVIVNKIDKTFNEVKLK